MLAKIIDASIAIESLLGTDHVLEAVKKQLRLLGALSLSLIALRLLALAVGGDPAIAQTLRFAGGAMLLMLSIAVVAFAASRYCNDQNRCLRNLVALVGIGDSLEENPRASIDPAFMDSRRCELSRCDRLVAAQAFREAGAGIAVAAFAVATMIAPTMDPVSAIAFGAAALALGALLHRSAARAGADRLMQIEALETSLAVAARKLGLESDAS